MTYGKFICEQCGKEAEKYIGHLNRSRKDGNPVYCNRICAGLGRRNNKTAEQKKKEKSDYDKEYRKLNVEEKKIKAQEYFKRTYDPAKAAIERKGRYHKHLQYLQTPEYKAWKKEYDVQHIAKKNYGDFWEAAVILNKLESHIEQRQAKQDQGVFNKAKKRKQLQS